MDKRSKVLESTEIARNEVLNVSLDKPLADLFEEFLSFISVSSFEN